MKRMERIVAFIPIVALAVIAGYSPVRAEVLGDDWQDYFSWEAYIWLDDGVEKPELKIGAAENATDGLDVLFEKSATFMMTGATGAQLQAYFLHPEASGPFWSDIRSNTFPQSWEMYVKAYRSGNITLTWKVDHVVGGACSSITLGLTDRGYDGTIADYTEITDPANGSYVYNNTSTAVRTFEIEATSVDESPAAPTGLVAITGKDAVRYFSEGKKTGSGKISKRTVVVEWDAVASLDGYSVYRSDNGGEPALISGDALVTDGDGDGKAVLVDYGLERVKAGTFTYSVIGAIGEECLSAEATVTVTR